MKILLLPSYLGPNQPEPAVFPIGLASIASMLKEHELLCWDPNVLDNPMTELTRILDRFEPDIVGLSLRNIDSVISSVGTPARSYYEPFVSTVKRIKDRAPSSKLVVGGPGFSIFAREIMQRNRGIDFGVISEGERAMAQLTSNLEHPERIKNIVMLCEGRLIFTGRDRFLDFGRLPAPSTEDFDLPKYRKHRFSMGVESKRGCLFRCIYCANPHFCGRQLRLKPPRKLVDEIERLATDHDIRSFYFADPVFNHPPHHAREICQEISRRNLEIEWQADFRPDLVNARLMMESVEAGCEQFNFSPDGGSDEAMKVLGKDMDIRSVIHTANWASGIENAKVGYSFVYDLPGSNTKHLMGLVRLLTKILLAGGSKVKFGFSRMRIYPHTSLYRIALGQRKITPGTDLIAPIYYTYCNYDKMAYIPGSIMAAYSMIFRKAMSMNSGVLTRERCV